MSERLSLLERRLSKDELFIPVEIPYLEGEMEQVKVNWDFIDKSTAAYSVLIQTYHLADILKSFASQFNKSKQISVFPVPGNLDISDKDVNFHDFYATLEIVKDKYHRRSLKRIKQDDMEKLRTACKPVVQYMTKGKHPDKDKVFSGWSNAFSVSRRFKKNVMLGVFPFDLPQRKDKANSVDYEYKASGTQHYVSFAYDAKLRKLFIFDSASKNPGKDYSEVYFILRFVWEELVGGDFEVEPLVFRNILQPGAGDKREENERSYNNQNVFCHTWSMWFCLVMICFYETEHQRRAIKFIRSLSHRDHLLNLAIIKRFAGFLTLMLDEEYGKRDVTDKFAIRAYERAKEKNDDKRLQEVLRIYTMARDPYIGLNYIYCYKNNTIISVESMCLARKVKMDVDLLESIHNLDINAYIEKSKEVRCQTGYKLYEQTGRCRKIK